MKNLKYSATQIAIVGVLGILLTGCGGGSSGTTTVPPTSTINGITVPPEPDATQNNSTIAGVDTNSNGVRDDVERKVAEHSTSNQTNQQLIIIAGQYQTLLTQNNTKEKTKEIYNSILCASSGAADSFTSKDIQRLTLNTDQRILEYKSRMANFTGVIFNRARDCK